MIVDTLPDTGGPDFRSSCPGCDPAFDPRRHNESWCAACRPREALGVDDARVRADSIVIGTGDTCDAQNQRAAGAFFRSPPSAVPGADEA
jgi:hypothetical protein